MTTTTTHTPATLAALPPRELDALAHEAVFGEHIEWMCSMGEDAEPCVAHTNDDASLTAYTGIAEYSADLNAVALLEAELARHGINGDEWLYHVVANGVPFDYESWGIAKLMAHASAKQRTIAAILATQEAK